MIILKESLSKTNFSQIESIYNKSHIAVEIVNMYNPNLLSNISTIASLDSGAYGIYNSGENKKLLPPNLSKLLVYGQRIPQKQLNLLPIEAIKKAYPQINPQELHQIQISDTIHVNVRRILREFKAPLQMVLEIASTIIHEAIHSIEQETTGKTSEDGPLKAENNFKQWLRTNLKTIMQKYPELA